MNEIVRKNPVSNYPIPFSNYFDNNPLSIIAHSLPGYVLEHIETENHRDRNLSQKQAEFQLQEIALQSLTNTASHWLNTRPSEQTNFKAQFRSRITESGWQRFWGGGSGLNISLTIETW
jgi:hypothetical protein